MNGHQGFLHQILDIGVTVELASLEIGVKRRAQKNQERAPGARIPI
jgi:hypothetical protein